MAYHARSSSLVPMPTSPPLERAVYCRDEALLGVDSVQACMIHDDSSDDLRTKSKRALKGILAKCTHLQVRAGCRVSLRAASDAPPPSPPPTRQGSVCIAIERRPSSRE